MEDVISEYLKSNINKPMSDALQEFEKTLQSRIGDRRYKLQWLSATSNGSGTSYSGIFSFCGKKYYINVVQPWAVCPNGKVIAEAMN